MPKKPLKSRLGELWDIESDSDSDGDDGKMISGFDIPEANDDLDLHAYDDAESEEEIKETKKDPSVGSVEKEHKTPSPTGAADVETPPILSKLPPTPTLDPDALAKAYNDWAINIDDDDEDEDD